MTIDARVKLLQGFGVFYHQSHQYIKKNVHMHSDVDIEHPILLHFILKNQPVLQKDLAKMMHIQPATLSVHLKKLEKRGYVIRKEGKEDKRQSFVMLTSKGEEVLACGKKMMIELSNDVTSCLSDEEVVQMTALISKMLIGLKKEGEIASD